MDENDLQIAVQVASGLPGVSPVAFVAFVEVIDQEGETQFVRIESNGLTDVRAKRILAALPTD